MKGEFRRKYKVAIRFLCRIKESASFGDTSYEFIVVLLAITLS